MHFGHCFGLAFSGGMVACRFGFRRGMENHPVLRRRQGAVVSCDMEHMSALVANNLAQWNRSIAVHRRAHGPVHWSQRRRGWRRGLCQNRQGRQEEAGG